MSSVVASLIELIFVLVCCTTPHFCPLKNISFAEQFRQSAQLIPVVPFKPFATIFSADKNDNGDLRPRRTAEQPQWVSVSPPLFILPAPE